MSAISGLNTPSRNEWGVERAECHWKEQEESRRFDEPSARSEQPGRGGALKTVRGAEPCVPPP